MKRVRTMTWNRKWAAGGLFGLVMLLGAGGSRAWAIDAAEDAAPADVVADDLPPGPDDLPQPPDREGMMRGPRAGAMLWRRMTAEEREQVIQFIATEYPEMYNRLLEAQARDPEQHDPAIGRILPEMMRMRELQERDPELFAVRKSEQRVEFEVRRLARRYRFAATDEERTALAEQIRPLVEKQFDIRQRRMEEEVSRLEERIAQLRQRIARQIAARDAEIETMYQRILEGGPGDFGPPGEGPPGDGPLRRERFRRGAPPSEDDVRSIPRPDGE